MAGNAIFPAFIRATYQDSADGIPAFGEAFQRSLNRARESTESTMAAIERSISRAMSGSTSGPAFNFDVAGARAAAQAAEARASAARASANAVAVSAAAEREYSSVANISAIALERVAVQEEEAAQAARVHAAAVEYAARALGAHASASKVVATATGAQRQASILAAQQFQDFFIQVQGGQNVLTAFSQQASQLAVVMTGAEGAAGKFARIFAGGWGTLLLGGVSVLTTLTSALSQNKKAHEDVALGANALASAQSTLGDVFDLVTGKIRSQNEVLQLNARLTAINLRADALAKEASSNASLTGARDYTVLGRVASFFNRAPGVGGQNPFTRAGGDPAARDPINNLLSGRIDSDAALSAIGKMSDAAFAGSGATKDEVLKAILDRAAVKVNRALADQIDQSLDTGVLATGLRKKGPKDRSAQQGHANDEFAETALDRVKKINEAWDAQPQLIDRARQAGRQLDDVISDVTYKLKDPKLTDAQRKSLQQTLDLAEKTRPLIEAGLSKPYNDLINAQSVQLVIQDKVLHGRQDEAAAMQVTLALQKDMTTLTEEQRKTVTDNVIALRQQTREIEIQRQKAQPYIDAVSGVRSALTQSFEGARTQGLGAFSSLGKQFGNIFDNLFANFSVDQIFGSAFQDIEDEVTGVKNASQTLQESMVGAAVKVEALGNEAARTANKAAGKTVANDNDTRAADYAEIVVTATKAGYNTDPIGFMGQVLTTGLTRVLGKNSPLVAEITDHLSKVTKFFEGTSGGLVAGTVAGGLVLGGSNSQAGSAIGGALGKKAGDALSKGLSGIFKEIGGPLGSIAGGILGGAIGGLFTSTKRASATIGANSAGDLVVTSLTGNSGSRKKASSEGADSTISSIERIAEALGGSVDASKGSVSIGVRKGNYRVDTTGAGRTKLKSGVLDFGSDAESAVRAATLNLIQDGVISGLRASTQRLLQQGTDLDAALQKALDFEGVFTRYKEMTDPVGAAIDAINKKFTGLQKTFKDAGASAEELAILEKTYNSERKTAAEEAAKAVTGSLKDLLDGINIGDSGYSLRTRLENAKAAYDPLAARVAAGDTTAYDDYSTAAQTLIDLQRQYSGSQSEYFDVLDQVKNLATNAVNTQQSLIDSANGSASIFNTTPIVDATKAQTDAIVSALNAQLAVQTASNDNLARLIQLGLVTADGLRTTYTNAARLNF